MFGQVYIIKAARIASTPIELPRLLQEVMQPQFNRVFFTGSGSESIDTMIRMVRRYWRKALVEITAGHKALEHLALDRPVDEPGRIEFEAVSAQALIQWTHPRIARAIDAAGRSLRVPAHRRRASPAFVP